MPATNSNDLSEISVNPGKTALKVPPKGHFTVHSRATNPCREYISASRRDYYKISLITKGEGLFTLGGRSYHITPPAIIFINQSEIKTWEPKGAEQDGYYCIFTEQVFEMQRHNRDELVHYPLFQIGGTPVVHLTEQQSEHMQRLFSHMMRESCNATPYSHEAIALYLQLLLLEAKRAAATQYTPHRSLTTAQLLAERFTETLEKQFPITSEQDHIHLKTAGEFAQVLNVHPNHLNATVKSVTGRTTTEHIRQRILLEARLLLVHTDWPIAAIARSLGFEEPASFSHFFKSQTSFTPHMFRTL